jgi:hypothetical protein
MQTETNLKNLTAEQRAALREMLLPDVRRWRAEDRLKDAKKRHGIKAGDLARERERVADLKAKEVTALADTLAAAHAASNERLARIANDLPRLESEAAEAQAELDAAAAELEAANG